jgi:hypothetical protein
MKAMNSFKRLWNRASRHWQTSVLLAGAAGGYLFLLIATEFRWVAWVLGAVICMVMLVAWFQQFGPEDEGDRSI